MTGRLRTKFVLFQKYRRPSSRLRRGTAVAHTVVRVRTRAQARVDVVIVVPATTIPRHAPTGAFQKPVPDKDVAPACAPETVGHEVAVADEVHTALPRPGRRVDKDGVPVPRARPFMSAKVVA